MPEFAWRAANGQGEIIEGVNTAVSQSQVVNQLRLQQLVPLRVEAASGLSARQAPRQLLSTPVGGARPTSNGRLGGRVLSEDVFVLSSELAIMLRAGLPLDTALRLLADMSAKPAVKVLVERLLDDVKNGLPFSKALADHPAQFSNFYVNMVRSGEASGQLAAILERLVEHIDRLRSLRESVVSASIYPAILLAVAVLSLVAMLGFVVPQFEDLFKDMGDALPLPTQWVMALGHLFSEQGLLIAVVTVAGGAVVRQWWRSASGRRWFDVTLLRMPVLGRVALKYQLTLFARSFGTLLGNGVPLLSALQIATATVGNGVLHRALAQLPPKLKSGGKLADAFAATGVFEPLAINLVRVGEETGRLGQMLQELAHIYNRDVENGIKRGLTLLEPLLILVLGGVIAAIIVSILLGILSVNDLAI